MCGLLGLYLSGVALSSFGVVGIKA
ncbi:hypothetical protein LCGC14_2692850, partial [marine sediment metagenome]